MDPDQIMCRDEKKYGYFFYVHIHFYAFPSYSKKLCSLNGKREMTEAALQGSIYTERKKKRRVEFFPSYFNHFLRCLL